MDRGKSMCALAVWTTRPVGLLAARPLVLDHLINFQAASPNMCCL